MSKLTGDITKTMDPKTGYEYEIIPYSRLNIIIKNCPKGFPFALKIKDVTPIKDADSVK